MGKSIYDIHMELVEKLKERGEEVVQPKGKSMNHIKAYDKIIGLKSAGTIIKKEDGTFYLGQDMLQSGYEVKWNDLGLCDARCWYEALDEQGEKEREKYAVGKLKEVELKDLIIHSIKELGEIAECIVKERPEHWKNELGDLCAFGIKPMLELAGIDFKYAIEIGLRRKHEKLQMTKKDFQ